MQNTKLKNVDEDIFNENQFIELALNAQRDTFFVFDPSTSKAIRWNKAFSDITGYTDEEIAELKAPESYYSEIDLEKAAKAIEKISEKGSVLVEMNLITKERETIPFEYSGTSITDESGNLKYIVSIGRNITERIRNEEALYHERELINTLLKNHPDFIYFKDTEARFHLISDRFSKLLGRNIEDIIGKTDLEVFPEEIARETYNEDLQVINHGKPIINKEEYAAGTWVLTTKIPWVDAEGNSKGLFGISRDITEWKRSEDNYRALIENFQGIAFQGYQDFSAAFFRGAVDEITGYREEDFISGKVKWNELIHLDDLSEINGKIRKFHETKIQKRDKREYRIIDKKGETKWILEFSEKFYDPSVKKEGVRGIIVDNTEKKLIEQKLKESERKFRSLVETTSDWIWEVDSNGVYTYSSPKIRELLGYELEEVIGRTPFDLMTSDDAKRVRVKFNDIILSQKSFKGMENNNLHKSGRVLTLETSATPIFDIEGKFQGYRGIDRDITKRKQADQKLKESEEKFRELFNNMSSGVAVYETINHGEDFIFKDFNLAGERIDKTSKEDLIGKKVTEVFPAVQEFGLLEVFQRVWKSGKPEHYPISLYQDKRITGWRDNYIYKLPTGEIVAVYDDVTEQKLAEQKLRESEEKYRLFVQNFQGIAYQSNFLNFQPNFFHGMVKQITGYTSEDLMRGKPSWDKLLHPEDLLRFIQKGKELSSTINQVTDIEYRIFTKNGNLRWVKDIVSLVYDNSGKLIVQGAVYDITEQKQSEERLKESERKLKDERDNLISMLNSMEDGVYIVNPKYNIEFINPSLKNSFGPIDNKKCFEYFQNLNEPCPWCKTQQDIDYGSIRWEWDSPITKRFYEIIATPIKRANGNFSKLVIFHDITKRKKAVNKIKKAREKADMYLNMAGVILVALDRDGIITLLNKKGYEILEHEEGELEGRSWFENCLPLRDRQRVHEYFEKLVNNEIEIIPFYENGVITKSGEERLISWSTILFRDNDGIITRVLSAGEDITERKKAEQELRESEEKYRILFESSPVGIGISDYDGNVHSINKIMEDITGYDLETYKQINIKSTYVNPDDRVNLFKLLNQTGKVKDFYSQFLKKDGSIYDALLNIDTITIANKKYFITNVQDISERKEVEKKINELNKLKSELLTRTSHELKTPAMHIKGYADLLLHKYKDNLGIDELQIISHIKKGVLRLETLIYDILHKAELDSGHSELNRFQNNLSSIIELGVKELQSFAALREHSIILDIDDNMIINFDKEQIRHVLNNLITNAIKYTPLNGIIGINSTITDDFITIAVQDNGIGLTEEQINRLFTQFGKVERYGQGFDIITEGSGLGLQIAKKIIKLHNGRIWVESGGRNKGSTFYFSLPK